MAVPVDAHKSSLLMITPEEQAHAILLTVASPRATSHKQWSLVLLSVPVYFDVITKEEHVHRAAYNARQLIL